MAGRRLGRTPEPREKEEKKPGDWFDNWWLPCKKEPAGGR